MFDASVMTRGAPQTRTRRSSRPTANGWLRLLLTPIFALCLLGTCLSCGPLAHAGPPAGDVGVEQAQAAGLQASVQAPPVGGQDDVGGPITAPARACAGCAGHMAPMPAGIQVAETVARHPLRWRSEFALPPPPLEPDRLDRPPRA